MSLGARPPVAAMSTLGSMGIRFVSKAEIEAVQQKADEARAASQAAAAAQRKVEGEAKRQRVASGDASWVAPAVERRLKHKKKDKKEKREKKPKKHKHKHRQSGSESSSEEEEAAAAREGQPAAPPAEAPKSRDAAGLGFMNAAPAGFGAALVGRRAGAPAPAGPTADEAAAEAKAQARIARELNPYADAAKDSSQWTRDGVARFSHAANGGDGSGGGGSSGGGGGAPVGAAAVSRPAGTDGGASWRQKQLLRAVEHAQSSGGSLQAPALERHFRDTSETLPRQVADTSETLPRHVVEASSPTAANRRSASSGSGASSRCPRCAASSRSCSGGEEEEERARTRTCRRPQEMRGGW